MAPVTETIDITASRFEEALREGHNIVLELIVAGAPLRDVLTALTRAAESQADGLLSSVLLLDDDGKHLRLGAAPSLPPEYVRGIESCVLGPAEGSCGTAAFRRQSVFVSDVLTHPFWEKHRDAAAQHGVLPLGHVARLHALRFGVGLPIP